MSEGGLEREIVLLKAALNQDRDDVRTMFRLGQSFRLLGRYGEALHWYQQRAECDGSDEERWYAMFQVAQMLEMLDRDWEIVQGAYLKAYQLRPSRLEPLYHIVRHYREDGVYPLGYAFAAMVGHGITYPDDRLFVEEPIYRYLLWLEYGVCACMCGRFSEAVKAFNMVLRQTLPQWAEDAARRWRSMALKGLYGPTKPINRRNRIVVITMFHNPGRFLAKCVESLTNQDFDNFHVLFLDDASTDNSADILPAQDGRVRCFRNPSRMGASHNLHYLLTQHCEPEDIVVCLDGDDWLACPDALSRINTRYNEHDCWVLYGQFRYVDGRRGFSEPFASAEDFMTARLYWRTSHLRSFRAGLFQRIAEQDPEYSCLKSEGGQWLEFASDVALMFPLLEMAGFDRVRFNESVLYIYNDQNPISEHNRDRKKQLEEFTRIARKRPFARIEDYRAQAL